MSMMAEFNAREKRRAVAKEKRKIKEHNAIRLFECREIRKRIEEIIILGTEYNSPKLKDIDWKLAEIIASICKIERAS